MLKPALASLALALVLLPLPTAASDKARHEVAMSSIRNMKRGIVAENPIGSDGRFPFRGDAGLYEVTLTGPLPAACRSAASRRAPRLTIWAGETRVTEGSACIRGVALRFDLTAAQASRPLALQVSGMSSGELTRDSAAQRAPGRN